ncbi:efflux RND transporter periplasmic adaptor subunit [Gracilibacillus oryzae]|uniref:Efflux RND transporter periplasmic adaptor subunit n=1 Tax=Gracilibacillus oryzae TaxID=1672701 RepID=A0A7C8L1B9_9BACI|nr:efflux RND transporter periplasmic adaptor subunit [Gracilibacillus oryzae]KAB8126750.1 efflux RND transporter periplasmic adaptor subunit [Gracilibacillus oryzae]
MKRLFLLLFITVITLAACSEDTEQTTEADQVTPVETGEVTEGNLAMTRTFYGRTMPNQTIPVIPSVPGEVTELNVTNGDTVEEGDTLATIQSQQGNINIEAPAAGTVTQLSANENSIVSNQEPFAAIIDLEQLTVQLQVPDVQLDLFQEGEQVVLHMKSAEEETHEATIEYVSRTAGESGLFPIDLSFDNAATQYNAGVIATVELEEVVVENATLIPTSALVETNDETFVYTIEDNQAKKVEVTVQATQSEVTAVEAELASGTQLITSGHLTLSDGSEIEIIGEE